MRNVCPQLVGFKRCNNCGKEGHFGKDCPTLSKAATRTLVQVLAQNQQRRQGNLPQATGRVYVVTREEAAGSGNLVMGCCMIVGEYVCVLYDFRATYSFVSETCVQRLGLSVCELQCDLVVSTLASSLVRTSSLCVKCPVEVEGRVYKVNLICLPL